MSLKSLTIVFAATLSVSSTAAATEILLDEHGCHYTGDGAEYHCHIGDFAGRTFPSKWRMLMVRREIFVAPDLVPPTGPARVASGDKASADTP